MDISQPGNPLMNDRADLYEDLEKYKEFGKNPNRKELIEASLNKPVRLSEQLPEELGYGKEYEPSENDTLGKVLNFTGELASPSPALPMAGYSVHSNSSRKGVRCSCKGSWKRSGIIWSYRRSN